MSARLDAIGNCLGRHEGAQPGLPCLMLGSHLDTVGDAGRFDGPLGVLLPIAAIEGGDKVALVVGGGSAA